MLTMAGLLVAATLWPLAMTGAGIRGVVEARIAEADHNQAVKRRPIATQQIHT